MSSVVKCVVIGDGAVGKTCLLMAYAKNSYNDRYIPTVFENYSVGVNVRDEMVQVTLCDTSGQEEYDRLRPLAYPKTNVFLICCSIVKPESFENAKDRWLPELRHHCPDTPFLLVGTQNDLRKTHYNAQSVRQGEKIAKQLGAVKYLECSAKEQVNVKDVFKEAIMIGMAPRSVRKQRCLIL